MKIKTVKVPIVEHHDGTESTGSDTCDSSGNMHVQDGSAGNLTPAVDVSLSPTKIAHYEKTIGMFAAAMTELQMELRDKTNECEALYETAHSLSQALQESDRLLQNKTIECERLSLKIQMVTFVELNDDDDPFEYSQDIVDFDSSNFCDSDNYYAIPQRPAAILDQMPLIRRFPGSSTRLPVPNATKLKTKYMKERDPQNGFKGVLGGENSAARNSCFSSGPVCVDDCADDDETVYSAIIENSEIAAIKIKNPVCVDDASVVDDDCRQTLTRTINDGSVQVMIGPSQAHFYRVILERDMAKQANSKLTRDLRYTRSKLRELKSKLDRSKLLLELTYDSIKCIKHKEVQRPSATPNSRKTTKVCRSDVDKESKVTEIHEVNASSSALVRSLPWRRNYGIGATPGINRDKPYHLKSTECVSFISGDEMLSKNWNNTTALALAAASTEKYMSVFFTPEDDADRAGGSVGPSSSIMDV
jgi:hypothetical protein